MKPKPTPIAEAFKACQDTMRAIFGLTKDPKNKRKYIPSISVELLNDHGEESIVIDGWIYLAPIELTEQIRTFAGAMTKRQVMGWGMSYGVYDPGVRYYPDGSGQPPSWDVADFDPPTTRNLYTAIELICGMMVKNFCSTIAENAAYEKMVQEENELEEG